MTVLTSLLITGFISCQWWLGFSPLWRGIDRSWLHLGFFAFWAGEAIYLTRTGKNARWEHISATALILVILAYKILIDGVLHYFPLQRTPDWFDGYLCQGLGAVALTVFLGRFQAKIAKNDAPKRITVTIAALALGLVLSLEYLTWPIRWAVYARGLGLSALWTFYASLLIFVGLRKQRRWLRLLGLAGLAAAIGKLLLYDLHWSGVFRILSFLIVGIVLFILAACYQRWGRVFFAQDAVEHHPTVRD